MATQSNPSDEMSVRGNHVATLSESARLRASARSFEGFIDQQRSRGDDITPELKEMPSSLRYKASAIEVYENRPLRCKLGFHRRRQSYSGSSYWGTCVICHREENI